MSDHFHNLGGGSFGNSEDIPYIHTISQSKIATERAISAYRNNIALPDVHVADRHADYEPVVVGEDGEELTPERRKQLMEEAGVKPMFDEEGKPTGQLYVEQDEKEALARSVFDRLIEPERLGKSAEENRPGYRMVRPKELELELETEITADTVAAAQHVSYGKAGSKDLSMIDEHCVYSSAKHAELVHDGRTLMVHLGRSTAAIYQASGDRRSSAKSAHMSSKVHELLQSDFVPYETLRASETAFAGCSVVINEACDNTVRLYGDPAHTGKQFAEFFIDPRLLAQDSPEETPDA